MTVQDRKPDLMQDILRCRIVDAQITMQLSCCPPAPAIAEARRQTQLLIRGCIRRMQEVSAP